QIKVYRRLRPSHCGVPSVLPVENRDRPRPAGGGALDLYWKARHHKTGRRQLLQIVQLLNVAIADVTPGLVAFPDQARIPGLGIFLRGIDKGRVPTPAVDAG